MCGVSANPRKCLESFKKIRRSFLGDLTHGQVYMCVSHESRVEYLLKKSKSYL